MHCDKTEYLLQFYERDILLKYKQKDPELFNQLYKDMQPHYADIIDLTKANRNWYVDSPDGFVLVDKLVDKGKHEILEVTFTDGTTIKTSPFHMFERSDGEWLSTINLFPGNTIVSNNGVKEVLGISDIHVVDNVYDLVIDSNEHRYYTNDLSSHNSGAGKSLFLQNLAVNWVLAGLNIVYITLELSEKLCSLRIDAMFTGFETREVMRNIDDASLKISTIHKKHKGELRVKQMPNGCTATDLRAYIKEYEIQSKRKVDGILVDYLDLMMPQSKKISAENLFVKDKYVTEELRNLAVELNVLMSTASQLNRSSHESSDYDHSHISGGISKINTADNVIGIFTSGAMKEAGRYQIQFMKTRSSSGVGSKIDLNFNNSSLKIYDLQEGDIDSTNATAQSIYDTLKKKSVVNDSKEPLSESAQLSSTSATATVLEKTTELRDFLKRR